MIAGRMLDRATDPHTPTLKRLAGQRQEEEGMMSDGLESVGSPPLSPVRGRARAPRRKTVATPPPRVRGLAVTPRWGRDAAAERTRGRDAAAAPRRRRRGAKRVASPPRRRRGESEGSPPHQTGRRDAAAASQRAT